MTYHHQMSNNIEPGFIRKLRSDITQVNDEFAITVDEMVELINSQMSQGFIGCEPVKHDDVISPDLLLKKVEENREITTPCLYPNMELFRLGQAGAVMKLPAGDGYGIENFTDGMYYKGNKSTASVIARELKRLSPEQVCVGVGLSSTPNHGDWLPCWTDNGKKLVRSSSMIQDDVDYIKKLGMSYMGTLVLSVPQGKRALPIRWSMSRHIIDQRVVMTFQKHLEHCVESNVSYWFDVE